MVPGRTKKRPLGCTSCWPCTRTGTTGACALDGEHEGALLERTEWVGAAACAFWIDSDGCAEFDALGGERVGAKRSLSVGAFDGDRAGGEHGAAEERDFEQLGLGDELDPAEAGGGGEHVVIGDVVDDEDVAVAALAFDVVFDDADAGDPEDAAGPEPRGAVVGEPTRSLMRKMAARMTHPPQTAVITATVKKTMMARSSGEVVVGAREWRGAAVALGADFAAAAADGLDAADGGQLESAGRFGEGFEIE